LNVCLKHEVLALKEQENGWLIRYKNESGQHEESFDYAILAAGQYTDGKNNPQFPGIDRFSGRIITERDVTSLDIFKGKRVAVVGYGKSALDMATLAAEQGAQVHHVFRTPSWLIPEWILGAHFTYALFTRFGNIMMTSWAQPTAMERFLWPSAFPDQWLLEYDPIDRPVPARTERKRQRPGSDGPVEDDPTQT
jgi:cation diffusion facilitator CzcD-associated flavoprotein CzcO